MKRSKIMNFDKSKTKENLARAFISECTDGARYQFMAKDAKAKGYGYISNLLKMIAKNEMAHARVFYDFILNKGKPGRATECDDCGYKNIDVCAGLPFTNYVLPDSLDITGGIELHESDDIYKTFREIAIEEGYQEVADAFHYTVQIEHCHYLQLKEIYDKMCNKTLYKEKQEVKWKCSNCGTELINKQAPKVCPMCGYEQGYYMLQSQND